MIISTEYDDPVHTGTGTRTVCTGIYYWCTTTVRVLVQSTRILLVETTGTPVP